MKAKKFDKTTHYRRIRAGDLILDTHLRCVSKNGKPLNLSDLSFATLLELAINAPDSVSNDQLAAHVWKSDHVTAETIAQRIRILRRVLDDNPSEPHYLRTVRNHGYAFIAPTEEISDNKFSGVKRLGIAALLALGMVASWVHLEPNISVTNELPGIEAPSVQNQVVARAKELIQIHQPAQTDKAISLLQTLLETEPENSDALVSLSFALSTRHTKFRAQEGDSQDAEKLARQAIKADPENGAAWHALAYSLDAQARVEDALSAYRMAYELDPTDISAMSSAAYLFQIRGKLFESLELEANAMEIASGRYSRYADTQIALSLDLLQHQSADLWRARANQIAPDHVVVLAETASAYLREANPDAAAALLSNYGGHDTASLRLTRILGRAVLMKGDKERARELFEHAGYRASTDLIALLALEGNADPAQTRIEELESWMLQGDSWPGTRIQLAELNSVLGNHESAIENISRAIDLGWLDIGTLHNSPFLIETLSHPGWTQLEQRMESRIAMQNQLVSQSERLQAFLSI